MKMKNRIKIRNSNNYIQAKIDAFCVKNNLFNNEFKKCILVNKNEIMSDVDFDQFKVNAKRGFILLTVRNICEISNLQYDICKIKHLKKEKELEKIKMQNKEQEKLYNNIDNKKIYNQVENLNNQKHIELMNKLPQYIENTNQNNTKEKQNETIPTNNNETDSITDESNKSLNKLEHINETDTKKGNKHYRRFIKSLKNTFRVNKVNDYLFFETKMNSTEIIIDNPEIYKLLDCSINNTTCYVIIGDFKIKNLFIKSIDNNYSSVIKEQSDYVEQIKNKEKENTLEH